MEMAGSDLRLKLESESGHLEASKRLRPCLKIPRRVMGQAHVITRLVTRNFVPKRLLDSELIMAYKTLWHLRRLWNCRPGRSPAFDGGRRPHTEDRPHCHEANTVSLPSVGLPSGGLAPSAVAASSVVAALRRRDVRWPRCPGVGARRQAHLGSDSGTGTCRWDDPARPT